MGENAGDRIKGLLSAATAASVYKVHEQCAGTSPTVGRVQQRSGLAGLDLGRGCPLSVANNYSGSAHVQERSKL